jgi:hypothetical protein
MPKSKQQESELVTCDQCGVAVHTCGLGSHSKSCARKEQEKLEDKEWANIVWKTERKGEHSN